MSEADGRPRWALALLSLALTLLVPSVAQASPGDLDPGFGTGGIVTWDVGGSDPIVTVILFDEDADNLSIGNGNGFLATRMTPDGQPDPTFGRRGFSRTLVGTHRGGEGANDGAIQDDGKVLLGGIANVGDAEHFALVRLTPDGVPDDSFGSEGVVTTKVGRRAEIGCLALQPDGRILVAGDATIGKVEQLVVARYNTDGSLDATFGDAGVRVIELEQSYVQTGCALQPDGRFLVTGYSKHHAVFKTLRFGLHGGLDPGFGSDGIVRAEVGGFADAVTLQPDGRIIVTGHGKGFVLQRYHPDGRIDQGFGDHGVIHDHQNRGWGAGDAAVLPNGDIVAAGWGSGDIVLSEYRAAGGARHTFGTDGTVRTSIGSDTHSATVSVQEDGRIVVGGSATVGGDIVFLTARYLGA